MNYYHKCFISITQQELSNIIYFNIMKTPIKTLIPFLFILSYTFVNAKDDVRIYPIPNDEQLSNLYKVNVNSQNVPVYECKVAPADKERRWKAMDDKVNSANYFDLAAFTYFDLEGKAKIEIINESEIKHVKVLPSSSKITPIIDGKKLSFTVEKPENLTVEINGEYVKSLHIFINPTEKDIPDKNDPNTIYFGAGIHYISNLEVKDNQTLYIAGGAVLRAGIDPNEKSYKNKETGLLSYEPSIRLKGNNIKVKGRGIIDGSYTTTHGKNMIRVTGDNISIEGVILKDPGLWTLPVQNSKNVVIDNIKIIGYRANSDGIDICSSHNVKVENCFIRTLDDLIVVKTGDHKGTAGNILVQNCVLWNQFAHALSIGAELTCDVENVTFRNCDIIHDTGREWSLRIFHADAATIKNIKFENIRIEESARLISLWIGQTIWSRDQQRGTIRDIAFENIKANGSPLTIELTGYDDSHTIENILFENIYINNNKLSDGNIISNKYVKGIRFK